MSSTEITKGDSPVTQTLGMIERAARDPSVDVIKMQALQDMQFRLLDRHAVEQWHEAVSSLPPIRVSKHGTIDLGEARDGKKRGAIPFARWEDMDAVLRPMLEAVGLFLTFDGQPRPDGGGMIVTGTLRHRTGHSLSASIPLPIDTGPGRNNLQAMGSTLSYGKRYCAEMLLNIIRLGEDDDGARGGMKFISPEQEAELAGLIKEIGREPEDVVMKYFAGTIHHLDEIEDGQSFERFRASLRNAVIQRSAQKP